jgi:hypothetical protein
LTGRPKWLDGIVGAWIVNLNATAENLRKYGFKSVATPALDTVLFSQMLCKIAHAFASAEILRDNFDALLPDFISQVPVKTENDDRRYYLVGGDTNWQEPEPYLHELGLGIYEVGADTFLIARIRLFAFMGAPVYHVVVGTIPESKRAAAIARLSSNNSRTQAL